MTKLARFASVTMRRASLTVALVLSLSATASTSQSPAAPPAPAAPAAPPAGEVTLTIATVNGSGCRPGTAQATMAPDNTGFRVTYADFTAQRGGSARPTDLRKNCQISIQVQAPEGFAYAIARVEHHGHAQLGSTATGRQRTNFYLSGSSDNTYVEHSFAGPRTGEWHTTDLVELAFEPCGAHRNININTELVVDEDTTDAGAVNSLSMDGSDGTVAQFRWAYC